MRASQYLGRKALHVPAYKKSDDPEAVKKLATLSKWKGRLAGHRGGAGCRTAAASLQQRTAALGGKQSLAQVVKCDKQRSRMACVQWGRRQQQLKSWRGC